MEHKTSVSRGTIYVIANNNSVMRMHSEMPEMTPFEIIAAIRRVAPFRQGHRHYGGQ
jgi:hypothetical protein